MESREIKEECKHCNKKTEKFVRLVSSISQLYAIEARQKFCVLALRNPRIENCPGWDTQQFRNLRAIHHNVERLSTQPPPDFFGDLRIASASVGVVYVDLIELVIKCSPIVHFAVKTAW